MCGNRAILFTIVLLCSENFVQFHSATSDDFLDKVVNSFDPAAEFPEIVDQLNSFRCMASSAESGRTTSTHVASSGETSASSEDGDSVLIPDTECSNLPQLLKQSSADVNTSVSYSAGDILKEQLSKACPALLYCTVLANRRTRTVATDTHDHGLEGGDHAHHDDHAHHEDHAHHHDDHAHLPDEKSHGNEGTLPYQLWLYATLAVIIISLCGLAGVAAVPIIQRAIYQQLLHFLVALAVGTLTGDALLHLMPHALVPHNHGHNNNHEHDHGSSRPTRSVGTGSNHSHSADTDRAVYLGLVALVGILVFFVTERLVAVLHGRCTRQSRKRLRERLSAMSSLDPNHAQMIERKMKAYSHSPGANHCHDDTNTAQFLAGVRADSVRRCAASEEVPLNQTSANSIDKLQQSPLDVDFLPRQGLPPSSQTCLADEESTKLATDSQPSITANSNHTNHNPHCERFSAAERVELPILASNSAVGGAGASLDTNAPPTGTASDTLLPQHSTVSTTVANNSAITTNPNPTTNTTATGGNSSNNNFTVIIHEHEHRHHGHTHTHGHVHQHGSAQTAGMMAMVIIGDALHNLTDGLALGAAFAAGGVAGGVSTTVAVFCHELPHEIGDFAVLLKAGMSVKMAVFYNVVSSVLCLLGMIVGMLLVSALPGFNSWLFAFIAGTFLYIALVDMLPELSVETPAPSVAGDDIGDTGDNNGANCAPNASNTEPRLSILLLVQVAGMVVGAGIMLAIALHEGALHSIVPVV